MNVQLFILNFWPRDNSISQPIIKLPRKCKWLIHGHFRGITLQLYTEKYPNMYRYRSIEILDHKMRKIDKFLLNDIFVLLLLFYPLWFWSGFVGVIPHCVMVNLNGLFYLYRLAGARNSRNLVYILCAYIHKFIL